MSIKLQIIINKENNSSFLFSWKNISENEDNLLSDKFLLVGNLQKFKDVASAIILISLT